MQRKPAMEGVTPWQHFLSNRFVHSWEFSQDQSVEAKTPSLDVDTDRNWASAKVWECKYQCITLCVRVWVYTVSRSILQRYLQSKRLRYSHECEHFPLSEIVDVAFTDTYSVTNLLSLSLYLTLHFSLKGSKYRISLYLSSLFWFRRSNLHSFLFA